MAPTELDLPTQLKQGAEELARRQGTSLHQFIVRALAEKVGGLKQAIDDPRFPRVTYRRGAAGWPEPILRGTGIRVQMVLAVVMRQGLAWVLLGLAAGLVAALLLSRTLSGLLYGVSAHD